MQWNLQIIELYCDVVHQAGVNHQAAEVLFRSEINAKESTDFLEEAFVFNVQVTQVTVEEISHVNFGNACNIKKYPTAARLNEYSIRNEEKSVCTVQQAGLSKIKDDELAIEEFAIERTKEVNSREDTTKVQRRTLQ